MGLRSCPQECACDLESLIRYRYNSSYNRCLMDFRPTWNRQILPAWLVSFLNNLPLSKRKALPAPIRAKCPCRGQKQTETSSGEVHSEHRHLKEWRKLSSGPSSSRWMFIFSVWSWHPAASLPPAPGLDGNCELLTTFWFRIVLLAHQLLTLHVKNLSVYCSLMHLDI